jgi:hypothetical protein
MSQMGFEPTISVFDRAKRVHALDRAVSVISETLTWDANFLKYGFEVHMFA